MWNPGAVARYWDNRQFFSLWYWGKSMMKNQQLYAEKSAYICWDFSRSFRPKTPPTTPFALFWYINFAGLKRKLTLSYKVFVCFLQVLHHLWDRNFFGKIYWAFLGESFVIFHVRDFGQIQAQICKNIWNEIHFFRPFYFDCSFNGFETIGPSPLNVFFGQWSTMVLLVNSCKTAFTTKEHNQNWKW